MSIMDDIQRGILIKTFLIGYVVNYKTSNGVEGQKILTHIEKTFLCDVERLRDIQRELREIHEKQVAGKSLTILNVEIISVSQIL